MSTHYQGSPQDVLALDTFIKFTRASNTFEGRLFQLDLLEGLTQTQFGVLETLFHLGSMCQGEISAKLLKSTGNITLVLDNLEKQGLVRRERQPDDRRSVIIHLTETGKQKIERIFPAMVKVISGELSVLTAEEQQTLGQLCRILGKKERN